MVQNLMSHVKKYYIGVCFVLFCFGGGGGGGGDYSIWQTQEPSQIKAGNNKIKSMMEAERLEDLEEGMM